ncbi:MAG TPA: Ig-like domain-containing protein [Rhodanobacteraceae bacterium]|nr:Ig-like domain-containing protein [Rhodanobacteraceae bacterium]
MQLRNLLALSLTCSLLAACGGSSNSSSNFVPPPPPAMVANFDPSASVIPFPNNLLFSGTTDLTVNIPVADPSNTGDPQVAINALDGFSTVAPWSTTFSAKVDPASLKPGDTVRVFEVTLTGPGGAVTGVTRELASPAEYVVAPVPSDADGKTIAIVPTKALKPMTSYMVVVTDGVKNATGTGATPSLIYTLTKGAAPLCVDGKSTNASLTDAQACQLEPVRQLVNAQEAAAATAGVVRENISLSWVATTESTTTVLQALSAKINAPNSPPASVQMAPTGKTLGDLGLGLAPIADIYIGAMQLPYYLGVPSASNPTAALTGFWKAAPGAYVPPANQFGLDPTSTNITAYNPFPVANATLGIPVIMTVPNAASGKTRPATGWPIVIFQHGITRNRTDMLGIAQTFAAQGVAVIAIDAPLHGLPPTDPFYIGSTPFGAIAHERTFGLDLSNNDTGAPGPDGKVDASGAYFINLQSLLTSRDNLRQAVADLVELAHAIPAVSYDGDTTPDFDGSKIGFVGQSLGGIIGTVFTAVDPDVQTSVLNVAGGGIARLLDGSVSIGPQVRAGLAAAGVVQGTPQYDSFFMAAQTVIDAADPINFAPLLAGKGVLLQEVVGSDVSPTDQVVPNNVAGAPLSGTDPLIPAMGLTQITATTQSAAPLHVVTRFLSGVHGSLLSPAADPAVTTEMQTEMASLILNQGHAVQVAVPSVLQVPAPASTAE